MLPQTSHNQIKKRSSDWAAAGAKIGIPVNYLKLLEKGRLVLSEDRPHARTKTVSSACICEGLARRNHISSLFPSTSFDAPRAAGMHVALSLRWERGHE